MYRSGEQQLGSFENTTATNNHVAGNVDIGGGGVATSSNGDDGGIATSSSDDRGMAASSGNRSGVATSGRREVPFLSSLCKNPKKLNVLWDEWEFGVGGRKPAKSFNSIERGASKSVYSF